MSNLNVTVAAGEEELAAGDAGLRGRGGATVINVDTRAMQSPAGPGGRWIGTFGSKKRSGGMDVSSHGSVLSVNTGLTTTLTTAGRRKKKFSRDAVERYAHLLSEHLDRASQELVDGLFERLADSRAYCRDERYFDGTFLSARGEQGTTAGVGRHREEAFVGGGVELSLPAAAVGWLSLRLRPDENSYEAWYEWPLEGDKVPGKSLHVRRRRRRRSTGVVAPTAKVELLKDILAHSTAALRITPERWPSPPLLFSSGSIPRKSVASPNKSRTGQRESFMSETARSPSGSLGTTGPSPAPLDFFDCDELGSMILWLQEEETETFDHDDDDILLFLHWYRELQVHPRVDLALFPSVRAFVADGIVPSWIRDLSSLQDKVKYLRYQRAYVQDLNRLLVGDWGANSGYSNLVHADFSFCGLDEASGLLGASSSVNITAAAPEEEYPNLKSSEEDSTVGDEETDTVVVSQPPLVMTRVDVPPLSKLPNIVWLNLSNNNLVEPATALGGLSSLTQLSHLDLSYNRLESMKDAFLMLGNIRSLLLTGNRLTDVDGLHRLFALERLALDYNAIDSLQDIAPIARLPELMRLEIAGNPLDMGKGGATYRVPLLNFFLQHRFESLPKRATYRQLLMILPVLDDATATKNEMDELKDLTFVQSVVSVDDSLTVQSEPRGDDDFSVAPTGAFDKNDDSSSVLVLDPPQDGGEGASFATASVPRTMRRRTVRKRPPRSVVIWDSPKATKKAFPKKAKVEETPTENEKEDEEAKWAAAQEESDQNVFSVEEVISSIAATDLGVSLARPGVQMIRLSSDREKAPPSFDALLVLEKLALRQPEVAREMVRKSLPNNIDSILPQNEFGNMKSLIDGYNKSSYRPLVLNTKKAQTRKKGRSGNRGSNPFDDGFDLAEGKDGGADKPQLGRIDSNDSSSFVDNRSESFPDYVGGEDMSIASTGLGSFSSLRLKSGGSQKEKQNFRQVEHESVYDGPESYANLIVANFLELYFRVYVFRESEDELEAISGVEDGSQVDHLPRIQLYNSDRQLMLQALKASEDQTALDSKGVEKVVEMCIEEVLACGMAATSRLVPNRKPFRNFHGYTERVEGDEAAISEGRRLIVCLTDVALYFVPEKDSRRGVRRSFPSAMPRDAQFQDGFWPHAIARHALQHLRRITIGFGFQRLTLHFSIPHVSPGTGARMLPFTYVLLTGNKIRTVSWLQKVQAQFKEGHDCTMDNDDKAFLDTLSAAVTPWTVGVVLRHQVLRQRWKRGDRDAIRRVCVVTDGSLFLLYDVYGGDGSHTSISKHGGGENGDHLLALVDAAELSQVTEVRAAEDDPRAITIVSKKGVLQRVHRWRLLCPNGECAETLVEDIRKAMGEVLS